MPIRSSLRRVPRWLVVLVAAAVVVGGGAGLHLFEPWKAFTDTTVEEALPGGAPEPSAVAVMESTGASSPAVTPPPAAASPESTDLGQGSFVSGEHTTTGTARLIRLADGSTVLRLEGLKTSEGPDVRVYLSTRPAGESKLDNLGPQAVDLGGLKGNIGSQNYRVPAGTDLSQIRSVSIWCKRFSVGFGAADLVVKLA